jgi:hypothetical protein
MADAIVAALPVEGMQCFFSDGVVVPLRTTKKGALKAVKQAIKVSATSQSPGNTKDVDKVTLICEPAAG